MSGKTKWSKASIIVSIVTFILGLLLTPIIVKLVQKNDKPAETNPDLIGKIMEGEFEFDEEAFDVRIKSGHLYSTEEVLLLEIHVENYGIAKLAFKKSEEPDIRRDSGRERNAYRGGRQRYGNGANISNYDGRDFVQIVRKNVYYEKPVDGLLLIVRKRKNETNGDKKKNSFIFDSGGGTFDSSCDIRDSADQT